MCLKNIAYAMNPFLRCELSDGRAFYACNRVQGVDDWLGARSIPVDPQSTGKQRTELWLLNGLLLRVCLWGPVRCYGASVPR